MLPRFTLGMQVIECLRELCDPSQNNLLRKVLAASLPHLNLLLHVAIIGVLLQDAHQLGRRLKKEGDQKMRGGKMSATSQGGWAEGQGTVGGGAHRDGARQALLTCTNSMKPMRLTCETFASTSASFAASFLSSSVFTVISFSTSFSPLSLCRTNQICPARKHGGNTVGTGRQ